MGSDKEHFAVIKPTDGKRVTKDDLVLFDGDQVMELLETYKGKAMPPVLYFSPEQMLMEHFIKNSNQTHCPIKGAASYWDLKIGDETIENAVWSYEDPLESAQAIKGFFGFDRKKTRVQFHKR